MEERRILITGATGFLGGHLVTYLSESDFNIIAVGGKNAFPLEFENFSLVRETVDLTDPRSVERLISEHAPKVVIHCAALAQSAACEIDPDRAHRINVSATENLLDSVSQFAPEATFIFVSTDLVFDGTTAPHGGFVETDTPVPRTVYAQTKYEAEQAVFSSALRTLVLRTSLIYGPPIGSCRGVFGWMFDHFSSGKALDLFVDEWRTPVFVFDICEALKLLAERAMLHGEFIAGSNLRLLHLAGPERINRLMLGQKICDAFSLNESLLKPGTRRDFAGAHRPEDASLCIDLARRIIRYEPQSLANGLALIKRFAGANGQ